MTNDNPLKAAREARKLSRAELAMLLGLPYSRVSAVELGHPAVIPPDWHATLDAAGFDAAGLARAYEAWRAGRATALRQAVAANG